MLLNFAVGVIFYEYDLEKPSILVTFLAILFKYGVGVLYAILIFGVIYRLGWFVPRILSHPAWGITGKLSFAGYMFHNFILQLIVMEIYQPIYMDGLKMVSWKTIKISFFTILFTKQQIVLAIGIFILCLAAGLFFALTVVIPVSMILYFLVSPKPEESTNEIALDVITERTPMNSK